MAVFCTSVLLTLAAVVHHSLILIRRPSLSCQRRYMARSNAHTTYRMTTSESIRSNHRACLAQLLVDHYAFITPILTTEFNVVAQAPLCECELHRCNSVCKMLCTPGRLQSHTYHSVAITVIVPVTPEIATSCLIVTLRAHVCRCHGACRLS